MTFDDIKKTVGSNIKYYDWSTNTWRTGRDVTETDIGKIVNYLYRDDLFPLFATQYPHDFRGTGKANSWVATGTVDATSTGTTLDATTAIFTNQMVGLYVYNSTDDESAIITGYTDTTTVTLNTTIGNTWDGDTIWVLGKEFTFGGDASDIYTLEYAGVKYSSSDTYYRNCRILQQKPDLYQTGSEVGAQGDPKAYLTTNIVSGVPVSAIGFEPAFTEKVTDAIKIDYVFKPSAMSSSGDSPRLPVDLLLVQGATAWAFRQKGEDAKAREWQADYERSKLTATARYLPTSTGYPQRTKVPRIYQSMFNRNV